MVLLDKIVPPQKWVIIPDVTLILPIETCHGNSPSFARLPPTILVPRNSNLRLPQEGWRGEQSATENMQNNKINDTFMIYIKLLT